MFLNKTMYNIVSYRIFVYSLSTLLTSHYIIPSTALTAHRGLYEYPPNVVIPCAEEFFTVPNEREHRL